MIYDVLPTCVFELVLWAELLEISAGRAGRTSSAGWHNSSGENFPSTTSMTVLLKTPMPTLGSAKFCQYFFTEFYHLPGITSSAKFCQFCRQN